MKQTKMGVGIVGTGWVSGEHIKAFQNNPHTEMRAVCSRRLERARQKIAEMRLPNATPYDDYDRMLASPDVQIISICTPHAQHAEQTIAAAQAGKHLLIEKPVALALKDLKAMRAAVRKARVRTAVCFELRWNLLYMNIRALLEQKMIGELFYGEVDYFHGIGPWYKQWEWCRKKDMGGSSLLNAGCHAVDGLRWFVGSEAVEVMSMSTTSRRNPLRYEYDPSSVTILKFRNGVLGKVASSVECIMPYLFNIRLLGDAGAIRNERFYSRKLPGQKGWASVPTILPDSGDVTHHPYQGEVDHFIDCILAGKESHVNLEDAVKTHEICFAAELSARQRKAVKLPLIK
jgi:predicted dehydrogenase